MPFSVFLVSTASAVDAPVQSAYALALFLAVGLSGTVAVLAWRRRRAPGAMPLTCFAWAMVIWALTYAMFWLAPAPDARAFWLNATYLGVVLSAPSFLAFVLQFQGRGRRLWPRGVALLAVEPALTLLLLWTDPWHGLFFADKRMPATSALFDGGPWFWLNVIYMYGMNIVAIVLLVHTYFLAGSLQRRQIGVILVGG
ncbi:MAG: GGDEF domain-containing protein, partial [Caldilineaceae bacterium]|nr:GGDEF domain-containing protein [Caldilineaceae bacterium]